MYIIFWLSTDYTTKLNYLFRDARFFLMKSNNAENIDLAKNKGIINLSFLNVYSITIISLDL